MDGRGQSDGPVVPANPPNKATAAEVGEGRGPADPRSRRRRTLHPDQRALPLTELADAEGVYGYSFVLTKSRPIHSGQSRGRRALVPAPYRDRERLPGRQTRCRAAPPAVGYPEVNTAWMWGALLAATIAGWLHQLNWTGHIGSGQDRPHGEVSPVGRSFSARPSSEPRGHLSMHVALR